MAISLFGNYGQQESQSRSSANSGFLERDKYGVSEGASKRLFGLSDVAEDMVRNQALPQFNVGANGLFKEQEGWANSFANNLFSKFSGNAAARGQLSPMNISNVVGGALTNAAGTILPMISQNLFNAKLIPEQIRTQRFQNAMSPVQALIQGLGSSSTGASDASGFNVGGGGSFGGGGGGGGGRG